MHTVNWTRRDTIALLVIPAEFLISSLLLKIIPTDSYVAALIPLALNVAAFFFLLHLYKDFFTTEWQRFRSEHFARRLLLCFLGTLVVYALLLGTRSVINQSQAASVLAEATGGVPYPLVLIASLGPLFAPLTEELIFRHLLFYKFRDNTLLLVVMCLVSAFLFGAIHYNNFGGNLALTIPYMIVALSYNLIYYFSKNIFFTMTIHFFFNTIQSLLPTLALPILSLFVS